MIKQNTKYFAQSISPIIQRALDEDIGDGDVTTQSTIPPDSLYQGTFVTKASGILAGLAVVEQTFVLVAEKLGLPRIQFTMLASDADRVEAGTTIATVQGSGQVLLTAERVALNFLQRMSGIATLTNRYVAAVRGTSATILDTRKTVPGLRMLDKQAVMLGGGQNHRIGLYDMALIKENHIVVAGGITAAVEQIREQDKLQRKIEVEVTNLTELQEALSLNVDQIMLDNMNLEQMREAVRITDGAVPLEASGNVSLDTVAEVAATGVDYISIGKLTHSVEALDISFLLKIV
ncbi:carboxylating nicotinate-nucleotide diphosphorylase [Chloroflexi bacterium TSY]|nr:carboxylating nicotinate-nucleotide diphosphorylase [Chloroflexi bacterium TSY]MBV7332737.1 carboxylating nicotinate-nucleotide diphosphorylase [Chloroflexi bacterium TSY]